MTNKPVRRISGFLTVLCVALWAMSLATAQEITPPYTQTPPKHLHKVGDHWTPYDPPTEFPEGANVYIIVQGDTLWDLAQGNLGDPYLWPRIWEANQYILDAHWIYPGDPLVIPNLEEVPTVAEEGTPGGISPEGPTPVPVAYDWDVQCSGFISKDFHADAEVVELMNGDEGQLEAASTDVIYSTNPDMAVQAGSEYQVLRPVEKVNHPVTGDYLGQYYRLLGHARALCTTDKIATLEILEACTNIERGDLLRPWEEVPIPIAVVKRTDQLDRWCAEPSGKLKGYIVYTTDRMMAVGEGNVVNIDVGSDDNIAPGDFFTIYKTYDNSYLDFAGWKTRRDPVANYENDDMPRYVLGQLVVLLTEKHTATARITSSVKQMEIGVAVELVAQ